MAKSGAGGGRGHGNGGGWPSTTGNPSGGGRSNNLSPYDDDDDDYGGNLSHSFGRRFSYSSPYEDENFDIMSLSRDQMWSILQSQPQLWEVAKSILAISRSQGKKAANDYEKKCKDNLSHRQKEILNLMILTLVTQR